MSSSTKRRWRPLFQAVTSAFSSIFLATTAQAIVDTNENGVSDLWEKHFNDGKLYATFDPQADPDGDGWTNEIEAVSGTDPSDGNQPTGCIRPDITHIPAVYTTGANGDPEIVTPEAVTITWPTLIGKQYTLLSSADLTPGSWIAVDEPEIGTGEEIGGGFLLSLPYEILSPRMFFRVAIGDTDSDFDLLADFEEHALGTNPFNAYSDSDFLSDTFEVFQAGSDPASSDTDSNGVPDHGESALLATGVGAGDNTYAPVMEWWGHTRAMTYNYSENTQAPPVGTGSLFTDAYWDGVEGVYSESPTRRPLGSLHGALNAAVPFPTDKSTGPNYMYPISSFCSTFAHSDNVVLREKQVRLFASRPTETAITRRLMVLRYLDHSSDIPSNIEAYSFTIPANGIVSPPQFFGQDYVPADRAYQFLDFYMPLFLGPTELGWDDTGSDPWCAANVGETTCVQMALSVPPPALPLLEIAVPSAYGTYISLSENTFPLTNGEFKITCLAQTPVAGAEVVLRLKADPTTIFAVMKVHVFEKRNVPVTIYRIYDSRNQQTLFTQGITDEQIMAGLNDTYLNQGNIHFFDNGASNTYDIRYDKSQSVHVELPATYFIDGKFPESKSNTVLNLLKKGQHGYPIPARLIIIIARTIYDSNTLGFTPAKDPSSVHRGCFIGSGVDLNVAPHEVGHALELAYKAVGQAESHDHGLWPNSFASDPRLMRWGLMYDAVSLQTIPWLRQEDWIISNMKALILK